MAGQWWEDDKVEGSGDFWAADKVIDPASDAADPVAQDAGPRADVEQEVITDRAENWRNRSIFKPKQEAGAGRGSSKDPRRVDIPQESEWTKEVRSNLPTIDRNLKISAPEPTKPKPYKSVLEGVQMSGGAFDEREAAALSRRDYAERVEREAQFAERGTPKMTEVRAPILSDRQKFAEANPITAGLAQSAANTLVGAINTPSVVAGLVNDALVRPVARAAVGGVGGDEGLLPKRIPNAPLVDDIRSMGAEYASKLSRKSPGDAWDDGDFGRWLMTQMSANSFSAAQSLGALFVPGAQATLLSSMGAVASGNAYADGDSAYAATLKGMVEAGSEMLPLKAAEKIKDAVLAIPAPVRQRALADAGKRLLAAGTAVTTNSLVGAIEESVAEVGGNAVDRYISGKNKSLFEDVDRAAIVGAAFGGAMSAPALAEVAMAPTTPEQLRARELSRAMDAANFAPLSGADVASYVAADASAQAQYRDVLQAKATSLPAAESPFGVAAIQAPRVDEKATTIAARDKAMAAIGTAPTVDDAIAAANATVQLTGRAVQLDNDRLLNEALTNAGIADALAPVQAAAQTADVAAPLAQPVAQTAGVPAMPSASTSTPAPVVWTGRRGDGYATPEDANRALGERQRLRPAYEWTVRQNAEGRFVLNGEPKGQVPAAAAVNPIGNTQGATVLQNAPQSLTGQLAEAGYVQPQETVRDLRDQADKVQRLQAAIARSGDDASSIELYRGGDSQNELGVGRQGRGAGGAGVVARAVEEVGRAAQVAFGWKPIAVTGLPDAFGVQYDGQVFIDVDRIAADEAKGNALDLIAIQTIGHETTHSLEKSKDPQDQADYARLREVVLANAKPGVVADRVAFEKQGQDYGEKEVVADISGSFWSDPAFWSRLYDLDDGSTMRRITYKFMENATKFLKAVKGSRFDNERFINNVAQVREVAAQVWASKAKRGDSLFGDTVGQAPSKSRAAQSNFEVAPDPNDVELSAKWNGLPLQRKLEVSRKVAATIVPQVLELRGAKGEIVDQFGSYIADTNPSFALRLSDGNLQQVSKDLGYVLSQDSMMNLSVAPFEGGSEVGAVVIEIGEKTFDEVKAIYDTLREKVPQVGGQSYAGGQMVVLNYSDLDTPALTSMVDAALDGKYNVSEDVFYSSFPQKEEYDYASGSNDAGAQGEGERGIRSRLGGLRSEATRAINDAIASYSRADKDDARAGGARDEQPSRASGVRDGQGRPDAQSGVLRGAVDGADRGTGRPPRYGTPQEGSVSAVGYHFSKTPRTSLNGGFYGTGLKGAEADRLEGTENADIRPRVFFYVDRGNGVMPEFGVGPHPHAVQLDNLYDVTADTLGLVRGTRGMPGDRANNWERAIVEAGFDGWIRRDPIDPQYFAVLVGKKHSAVPVAKANPRRIDGKANIQTAPTAPAAESTRKEGDELVRRPVGSEIMEIIKAQQAGLDKVAPSFLMMYGEARVLESEAATADAVFEQQGAKFRFGELGEQVSRSSASFDELGGFGVNLEIDDLSDESLSFLDDTQTLQAVLQAELETSQRAAAVVPNIEPPTAKQIAEASYRAGSDMDLSGAIRYDPSWGSFQFTVPQFARNLMDGVHISGSQDQPNVTVRMRGGISSFIQSAPSMEVAGRYIGRQVAGAYLDSIGFDIAGAYRKGTIQKLASTWRAISKAGGFFKLPGVVEGKRFQQVADALGAFKGYTVSESTGYSGTLIRFTKQNTGEEYSAEFSASDGAFECCTMRLRGASGLGTEFYAVMGQLAENVGLSFKPDSVLSGINTYRRTEQAMSYALKSGRTDVLLPGPQNRVHGFNESPMTQEDHDRNLARLAIAGMRNAEELFPDVRRLSYDPATDKFVDSRGRDAEKMVEDALKDPQARAFGLGRASIARAVITSQILKGSMAAADVSQFSKPIAYSKANVDLDAPMAEAWGDDSGLSPNLRRFIAGSKIVKDDGTPIVMYHGTARDIEAFRAKQAGAIFLSYSPRFAEDFAANSANWMRSNYDKVLSPEQIEAAKKVAIAQVMADKSIKLSERKAMKQSILDGKPEGMAEDAMAAAVADQMPSGENIIPVFVRATAPFDFRIPSNVQDVIFTLQERQGVESGDAVTVTLVKEGGEKMTVSEDDLEIALRSGMWEFIESPEIQAVIRDDLGHDGFFVKEGGQLNLAVYDPGQAKSVFNRGTFDTQDERLSYSRVLDERTEIAPMLDDLSRALASKQPSQIDRVMLRVGEMRKKFSSVNGAALQEQLIDAGARAVERAVRAGVSADDARSVPVPIGATPHTMRLFGWDMAPLRIDSRIIGKSLVDKHAQEFSGVPASEFVRAIYQPMMVTSLRNADEFEVVTSLISKSTGLPVIFVVKRNSEFSGQIGENGQRMRSMNTHAVMSAYSKPSFWKAGVREAIKAGRLLYADVGQLLAAENKNPALGRALQSSGASNQPVATKGKAMAAAGESLPASSGMGPNTTELRANLSIGSALQDRGAMPASRLARDVTQLVNVGSVKGYGDLVNLIGSQFRGDGADMPKFSRAGAAFDGPETGRTPIGDATTVEVDGKTRPALNSKGQPIHWSAEGVRNFWRWFGESLAVDAEGRPLVVYHGTAADITKFKPSARGSFGSGVYFADAEGAEAYAGYGDGSNILPVYLSLKYPLEVDADYSRGDEADFDSAAVPLIEALYGDDAEAQIEKSKAGDGYFGKALQKEAERQGYDGLALTYPDGSREFVAFNPAQIKSATGNNGNFDPEDNRISYSRAALDDYMVRRNKTMPTISGAAAQEADIALAVKAINAVSAEIERGNKASVPIQIGRTPHVIGLVGGTSKMMRIDASILRKVLFDKHADDFAGVDVERFIRAIYQPAMVLSGREKGGYEVVTDIITKSGPIIVPLIDSGNSTAIMSAYAKKVVGAGDSLVSRIKGGKLLYADPVLAQSALTGRDSAPVRGINAREQQFSSAPPRLAQPVDGNTIESDERIQGIKTSGARFPSAPPRRAQVDNVNQPDSPVKPLNPNYIGWAQVREAIIGGIRERKVKSDVDLMRRIGDLYRGDWADAPSFSKANGGFDLPSETRAQKARRKMQDYFLRSRMVQEAIASQGGEVNEQTDFYRAEELSHGRIASLLQDFADQQVQPLMEKAVKFGIELDELSLYAYAMHAKERNAYIATIDKKMQDGGSGMTNAEADSILQLVDLSGDKAKFEELHNDLMTITRGNRMAMLADGLITQEEFSALEGAYDYYVPLRGFEKMDENDKPTGRSAGKGFNIRGAETLKAKGRVSRAGQIIENIIADHQRTIVRGERNHVAKVFLNFALTNPDPNLWEIDATTTRKSIDRQTGRIARNTVIEKGEDTIAVKVKGHEIYIKVKDDLLLRALRKSYTDETGELTSDLMKSVGMFTSLLRNTLTRYNPEFAVVNAMRDIGFGAAAALDELGEKGMAKFLAHYAGAMAVSARNESKKLDASREWDKWFLEYKAAGGTTSGFYVKGLDEISGDIRGMMIEAGAATKDWSEKVRFNTATRAAKAALRVLEYAGSVSENAARVSAYRTAREMGRTPSQAASIAKNLTTNFDRKGEYGQLLNALYLFYNAAIQGTQRTLKMFRNPKIMGYMAGVSGAAIGLAMANAVGGGDDPDDGMAYWDKIPAHIKERNIIIMLPPGAQVEGAEDVGTKGRYLTIPVQYGLNIFHVFGYQIADLIRNQSDPVRGVGFAKAGVNLASAMAGAFNPFGGAVDVTNASSMVQAILPTVFDVPYQFASGTNAFGRDVAPFKSPFDSKPDSQNSNVRQTGGPAEHVAQWLNSVTGGSEYESGVVDISAGTVENLVRNLTGGTGVFIYDVLALGGKWVEHIDGGDPDLYVKDIPILRRVTGETAGDVDQGLFYERRKAIQEARAMQKGADEAGGEIKDKEKIALAGMSREAAKYTKYLSDVRKEMKEAQKDDALTTAERRLKMRELRAERDRLTAEFNASFTETMREELSSLRGNE